MKNLLKIKHHVNDSDTYANDASGICAGDGSGYGDGYDEDI